MNNKLENSKLENKRIIRVLISLCVLFFILIGYLTYFQLFQSNRLASNPYNKRILEAENSTLRGSIYDRNGIVLASSKKTKTGSVRIYPYDSLYSQVIGYNSRVYGKSLLEASYNSYLLGISEFDIVLGLKTHIGAGKSFGDAVYLSIDHKLQKLGEQLLNGRNGAVVAMDPKTGEILAMVSNPSYNPNDNELSYEWQSLVESSNHPFVPRATQGLYVPGSTYKVVTSAAAIENGLENLTFNDVGKVKINGKWIRNQNQQAHGTLDLKGALTVSSNVVFSQIGVKLGGEKMINIAERFGLNKSIIFDIPVKRSIFPYVNMGKTDLAAAGMGQGKIMVTPLEMAMITSGIANKGKIMKPVLVKSVLTSAGEEVISLQTSVLFNTMKQGVADKLKIMMQNVVENGTGKNAKIYGIHVAGKTGTAENELTKEDPNKSHAWFISFAPVENPQIAVAVVIEYGGSTGGQLAAPIAQKIMAAYLGMH